MMAKMAKHTLGCNYKQRKKKEERRMPTIKVKRVASNGSDLFPPAS